MAVAAKAIPGNDIVNGHAVVMTGSGRVQLYDNTQRTQHIPDTNTLQEYQTLDGRYLHHGGPAGSGTWEH